MTSLIGALMKKNSPDRDKIIVDAMQTGDQSAATTYLSAIMKSTTPEIRAIFIGNLNQVLDGHSSLLSLALDKGWAKPYEDPQKQLLDMYKESEAIVGEKRN